jgi:site-specific DNA-methyltransferase (adenine-specific)
MELMARYADKYFDLAIVDPPYGININMNMGRRKGMGVKHKNKNWDNSIPNNFYFDELFRVSKNQIIWGGNYFELPPTRSFIIWDKMIPENLSFAMSEFAWSSFDRVSKIFRKPIQTDNANRIHPTQKPQQLYKWLLDKYANKGDKILDTHLGSGSIALACYDYGFELTACELDKEYFDKAMERIKNHTNQTKLF